MSEAKTREMEAGMAKLRAYLTENQLLIVENRRPWPNLSATYFKIARGDRFTDIVISDNSLRDLPGTKELQGSASSYAAAIGGRAKCGSPEFFYCQSGVPVKIEAQWPIKVGPEMRTYLAVNVTNLLDGKMARCLTDVSLYSFPYQTPFDDHKFMINHIRRAVDIGEITFFEREVHPPTFQKIERSRQSTAQKPSSEILVSFLGSKAYLLGFKASDIAGEVWISDPWDAEYLGSTVRDLIQAGQILQARNLIMLDETATYARPSAKLIDQGLAAVEPVALVQERQKYSLSSLPNKEKFVLDVTTSLENGDELALVMIDLDHFKKVNDMQGHAGGDACLERVVQSIGRSLGRKGTLYRWGGDEFAVCLRDFSTEEAYATAERIRQSVENAESGNAVPVTTSIGVCSSDQMQNPSPADFFKAADDALYKSKNSGKNRVTSWPLDENLSS